MKKTNLSKVHPKYGLLLLLLAALSGCGKKNKSYNKKTSSSSVDFPMAQDDALEYAHANMHSIFDTDLDEMVDLEKQEAEFAFALDTGAETDTSTTYAYIEAADFEKENFKTIYFDFDKHSIRSDQAEVVAFDASQAQRALDEAYAQGITPTIVIEGHADHAAGSAIYNLALSEKRAKTVADWFVAAGVPKENVKIVGRGKENPILVDGKSISGDRDQQWPNRRVEVHFIYS